MLGRSCVNIGVGTAKGCWYLRWTTMVTSMASVSSSWNSYLFSLVIVIVSRYWSYLPSGSWGGIPAQSWIQAITELVTNGATCDALSNHTRCSCCFCSSSSRIRWMVEMVVACTIRACPFSILNSIVSWLITSRMNIWIWICRTVVNTVVYPAIRWTWWSLGRSTWRTTCNACRGCCRITWTWMLLSWRNSLFLQSRGTIRMSTHNLNRSISKGIEHILRCIIGSSMILFNLFLKT